MAQTKTDPRFSIMPPGMWENDASPALATWFAVVDERAGGIVAYAGSHRLALRILRALRNGGK